MAASFQACVSAWKGDRSPGLKVEGRALLQEPRQWGSGLQCEGLLDTRSQAVLRGSTVRSASFSVLVTLCPARAALPHPAAAWPPSVFLRGPISRYSSF